MYIYTHNSPYTLDCGSTSLRRVFQLEGLHAATNADGAVGKSWGEIFQSWHQAVGTGRWAPFSGFGLLYFSGT